MEILECAVAPTAPSAEAEAFYAEAVRELTRLGIPFLIAGTYAFCAYTGVSRETTDLDLFCRPDDWHAVLQHFKRLGFTVAVEDPRWLGKVFRGTDSFDLIFASRNGQVPVTADWFTHARDAEMFGSRVRLISPTELIRSKAFVQVRHRYDGADIAQMIVRQSDRIDWHRLLAEMAPDWEILLLHVMNFRWVYPGERERVPRWLMKELTSRLVRQLDETAPAERICRGRLLSHIDYETAYQDWGFAEETERKQHG